MLTLLLLVIGCATSGGYSVPFEPPMCFWVIKSVDISIHLSSPLLSKSSSAHEMKLALNLLSALANVRRGCEPYVKGKLSRALHIVAPTSSTVWPIDVALWAAPVANGPHFSISCLKIWHPETRLACGTTRCLAAGVYLANHVVIKQFRWHSLWFCFIRCKTFSQTTATSLRSTDE